MLLSSTEFSNQLAKSLEASDERVIVLSAFIKLSALQWLLDHTPVSDIIVVARWQPLDLVCGASDFQCYQFCREQGIPFGISLDLHGKVYCVDDYILVGSANLTSRGMGLSKNMNSEVGIRFVGGVADHIKIEDMLRQVTWLNDDLAASIQVEVERVEGDAITKPIKWPNSILDKMTPPDLYLWAHEMPFTLPHDLIDLSLNDENRIHDIALLGVEPACLEFSQLLSAFEKTKAFRWLADLVDTEISLSFGKVTAELHHAIIDDPTPYRQEIKSLVRILLGWAKYYPDQFEIIRPRYSTVIRKA